MNIGDEFSAEILKLSPTGDAIAKVDGKVIFLPHGVPEQKIRGKITRRKRRVFFGEIEEVLKKSPHERLPLDAHFKDFGGAPWQNIDEKIQLHWKRQFVHDAFERIGKLDFPEIEEIAASPIATEYRNKMEFSFGYEQMRTETAADGTKTHFDENPGLGLHHSGNWREISRVRESCLAKPLFFQIAEIVERFALASELPVWNPFARKGFWRNLVVRYSARRNEALIEIFVFEKKSSNFWNSLITQLRESFPEIIGILATVHDSCSVAERNAPSDILFGRDFYQENFCEMHFSVSHNAFFQVNIPAAENLVATIAEFLDIKKNEELLDLFCGSGTLGITVGKNKAKKIVGIELNEKSILDARKNAAENRLKNTEFFAGDAAKVLAGLPHSFSAAIIDPPRAGLSKKARKLILDLPVSRLAMVSCNPATLARDLSEIVGDKWKITRIRPVDLFPQTPHVETVALLENFE